MQKNGWFKKCQECGKKIYVTPSQVKAGRGKYCSRSCASKNTVYSMLAVRGEKWKENIKKANRKQAKMWKIDPTTHPRWKGDNVEYFGVHDWIEKVAGKPKECEICGLNDKNRAYNWANISGKYKRERGDWMRLCVSCHRKYDYAKERKDKKTIKELLIARKP